MCSQSDVSLGVKLVLPSPSTSRCYEQAAMISKELNDWDSVVKYYEKSCYFYREHGIPDTAALTLNRGAQYVVFD